MNYMDEILRPAASEAEERLLLVGSCPLERGNRAKRQQQGRHRQPELRELDLASSHLQGPHSETHETLSSKKTRRTIGKSDIEYLQAVSEEKQF